MEMDPTITMAKLEGAEGDDLVAAFYLENPGKRVVAIDKDLQGVPDLYYAMEDYQGLPPNSFWGRRPKYILNTLQDEPNHLHVILVQCLTGDRSDSIPRLLPSKGAARIWRELYVPDDIWLSFMNFSDLYSDEFFLNLNLVLMPGPPLRNGKPLEYEKLIDKLVSGEYWEPGAFEALRLRSLEFQENRFDRTWYISTAVL